MDEFLVTFTQPVNGYGYGVGGHFGPSGHGLVFAGGGVIDHERLEMIEEVPAAGGGLLFTQELERLIEQGQKPVAFENFLGGLIRSRLELETVLGVRVIERDGGLAAPT